MNRIIYTQDNGTVAVIIPTQESLDLHGIQAIAMKDVPAGKPYKIVDATDIPSDRTFRAAWEVNEASLTDGTGSEINVFDDDPAHPNYVNLIQYGVTE
jgi:hypothetical protein